MKKIKFYLLAALFLFGSSVFAAWPEKPIKLVVPYNPGGTTDIVIRKIQPRLIELLGQPVIVEYIPGASSIVGATKVSQSHDEYTFLVTADELVSNSIADPNGDLNLKHFRPVAFMAYSPIVVFANSNSHYKTTSQFLNAKELTYANGGLRSISALMLKATNPNWTSVPYKSGSLMFNDVIPGTVDVGACSVLQATTYIQAGRINPLMVYNKTRMKNLPDVPTSYEMGIKEEGMVWLGVVSPASTDDEAVHTLAFAIIKALSDPIVVQPLIDRGLTVEPKGPTDFGKFLKEQEKTIKRLLK